MSEIAQRHRKNREGPTAASGAKRPFARKQHATTSELVDLYAVGGNGGCGQQERQSSENPKSCLLVIAFVSDARKGRGFRIAKNQFQKDSRRRPNEEAALAELR